MERCARTIRHGRRGINWISRLENDPGDGEVLTKPNTMHAISRFGGGEVVGQRLATVYIQWAWHIILLCER